MEEPKNSFRDYITQDSIKYIFPIVFAILTFCVTEYFDTKDTINKNFQIENKSQNPLLQELKISKEISLEILKTPLVLDSLQPDKFKRISKVALNLLNIKNANDTIIDKQLSEISELKQITVLEIAAISKFEDFSENKNYHTYKSNKFVFEKELLLIKALEEYALYLQKHDNNSDSEAYRNSRDAILEAFAAVHLRVEKAKLHQKIDRGGDKTNNIYSDKVDMINIWREIYLFGSIISACLFLWLIFYCLKHNIFKNFK